MAVRTGRNVQRSALRCNRNTSGYATALPISSCKSWMRSRRSIERNFFEHTLPAQWIVHEGQSNEIGKHLHIVQLK